MRILYIVTAFPRWPGDVITPWLTETITRLNARNVQVEVLAPSYRGSKDSDFGDVRVHRFRYAPSRLETLTHDQTAPDRIRERPLYLGLVPGYVIAGSAAAVKLARERRFDCVHAFWPIPHGLFGLSARAATGVPLISTFFGVELTWVRHQFGILRPLLRKIIRSSDAVTVISSHTAAAVREIAGDVPTRIIPFGAAAIPAGSTPPRRRNSGQPFQLLFVGRLVERKGVAVLLEAVSILRTRDIDVRLTVVGDGPLAQPLRDAALQFGVDDVVTFSGFITSAELSEMFSAADAFVLPAVRDSKGDEEGLGVVLIEAIMHAVPVIASRSGGIPDIVRDGETGLLAPPGDAAALAGAIERLMSDVTLRERCVDNALQHVERTFSWDRIISELTAVYQEVSRLHPTS